MYKRNIYIMYLIALFQGLVFYAPVATLYREAQGVTILQITIIEGVSMALCMVLELPWGIIADKIGYKKTLILCNVLYFLSKIVFWKATDFNSFLAERIMLAIVCAGLSGVDTTVLYLSCEEGESQKVFGIFDGLGTAGLFITSFVYTVLIGDDYSLSGFLTVISYGIAMAATFFLKEVKKQEEEKSSAKEFVSFMKETLKNRKLFLFLVGIALLNETHQTVTVFLSQLQYVRAGIGNSAMGFIYGVITLVALCGIWSDDLTKRIGEKGMMRGCYLAGGAACIFLAFTSHPVLSVAGIIVLRIVFSLSGPLQTELQNRQITTSNRATALSVNSMFISSVGIGTNIIFGTLAEKSLVLAFGFGAVACLTGWLCFEIWNRMYLREKRV